MEECSTCKCGCQKWKIFRDRIVCADCGNGWELREADLVSRVNNSDEPDMPSVEWANRGKV